MNSISIAFQDVSTSFNNYCQAAQKSTIMQNTMVVILKVKEFRNDPDFFQKVCQIALAVLQLTVPLDPSASLSRFAFILISTSGMHDFLCILKQPVRYFFPISAESINENIVLEDLTKYVYLQLYPPEVNSEEDDVIFDEEDESGDLRKQADESIDQEAFSDLRGLIKASLEKQLKDMTPRDACRSVAEFNKKILEKALRGIEREDFNKSDHLLDDQFEVLEGIDLSDLNEQAEEYHVSKWVRHVPLLQKITDFNWAVVDVGCVALFLQAWNLLDTAKWANRVGEYSVFQWIKEQHLERVVVGLVCTAYAWKCMETCRKLFDEENLTQHQISRAYWDIATSFAESTLYAAIYLSLRGATSLNAYLPVAVIAVKTLGLVEIAVRPKRELFPSQ